MHTDTQISLSFALNNFPPACIIVPSNHGTTDLFPIPYLTVCVCSLFVTSGEPNAAVHRTEFSFAFRTYPILISAGLLTYCRVSSLLLCTVRSTIQVWKWKHGNALQYIPNALFLILLSPYTHKHQRQQTFPFGTCPSTTIHSRSTNRLSVLPL
jgi:hypothetical protein